MRYKVCAVRRKRGGSEERATFGGAHECTGAEGEVQPKKKTKVLMGYDEQIKRAGDNLGTAEASLPRSIRDNSLIVPWMIKSTGFFNNAVGSAVNVHVGYGYAGTSGMGHNKKALLKRTRVRKERNIKRQRKKRGVAEEPPFPFGRNRIQVIAEAAHEVYDWVMNCTSTELKREWIADTRSSMETRIKGERLKAEMSIGGRIGNDVCSLIFRILEREDHELYKYQVVKRSRHFIPPEWGVQVLIQGDYLNSDKVKAMFIAAGLGYDPKDCELFIVPVSVAGRWVCYFWDVGNRRLTIIDPVMSTWEATEVEQKHKKYVEILHGGFRACKEQYLSEWDIETADWEVKYMCSMNEPSSTKADSALHVFHYARHFDGQTLHYGIDQEYAEKARKYWMYKLLNIQWNSGHLPSVMCVDLTC
ncbi:uncharacterized protein LOC133909881 [Phragmites australis]|uniref:uncharacterized protein LOC133909881 n=1 Tax=Phragmites australis TaxID=29695 RepID=UPI002D7A1807|nr:uncharacterized protein LOC133909881 [Phragmites australis]